MYIEPITCSRCGRTGRPAEEGFQSSTDVNGVVVHCQCGETITLRGDEARDQAMLSMNTFARLSAASNHTESGTAWIPPGQVHDVTFAKPFDFPCRAFLTPNAPVALKEAFLTGERMQILCSVLPSHQSVPDPVEVFWLVFGLVDVDSLPTWYVHFYGALTQLENGLYKPALIDYAVAFESFTEAFLADRLARRVGEQIAGYLLRRTSRIEDRVKDLLELAIGARLSSRADVYQPWDEHVRTPRNRLAHGDRIKIDRDAANRAHAASYQAIRWIQALTGRGDR
jgi:hypothetical protein